MKIKYSVNMDKFCEIFRNIIHNCSILLENHTAPQAGARKGSAGNIQAAFPSPQPGTLPGSKMIRIKYQNHVNSS